MFILYDFAFLAAREILLGIPLRAAEGIENRQDTACRRQPAHAA
jgi:hypothetical protein